MTPLKLTLVLVLVLPLFLLQTTSAFPQGIPRLSPYHKLTSTILRSSDDDHSNILKDFKTYYYNQTLDHFSYTPNSYVTFKQRYVVDSKYWGGPNSSSPIFAFLGAEGSLDNDLISTGFLNDNAPYFKSLIVFIEHRFYGESNPSGSMEEAMKDNTTRGYLNSAQALADYAEVLLHIKNTYNAPNSPIIVFGGSYGGMLASWFRLKYPHIALGALASSAPILYFDNITLQNGYYSVVTNDFKEVSHSCYEAIRKSWTQINQVASSKPTGLSDLSHRFRTCSQLNSSGELKEFLESMYADAAQYNAPPYYPVSKVCEGINGVPKGKRTDILGRIFAGVVSYFGNKTCYDTKDYYDSTSETVIGWDWQSCTEMVMPIGIGENNTMFQASPFSSDANDKYCNDKYGVRPRPHWITTYYGGQDIKLVLNRFASNIIFSNGLKDPFSAGGVLQNISKSVVAVTTYGSHCLDILPARQTDPKWLIEQRNAEIKMINKWLTIYYCDLHKASKK